MGRFLSDTWFQILSFLAFFLADIQAALYAIGFLIIMDTILGVWSAWKQGGSKAISSRKMSRVLSKIILYPSAIIVAKVSQDYLTLMIPWIEVTSGIIATVEVKSIFENMSRILGYDLWQRIKERLWPNRPSEKTPLK